MAAGLYTVFRSTALEPLLTGSLLLCRSYHEILPPKFHDLLPAKITEVLGTRLAGNAIKLLLALGVLRRANNLLTHLAVNNYTSDTSWDWKKEVVLITGGSSGIGLQVTLDLSKQGVKVVVLDIQPPTSPLPPNAFYYEADVTSSSSIKSAAEQIRKDHGEPTVLVNNAGIGTGGFILDKDEKSIRKIFDINTISHFIVCKEFVPSMVRQNHGHVVTIASSATFVALTGMVDYACTKASALAFHEGLRLELNLRHNAPKIRTTIVHPSWTKTPLTEPLWKKSRKFRAACLEVEEVSEAIVKQILSGNSGQLILPSKLYLLTFIRDFPTWLQEMLRTAGSRGLVRTARR